jgi:hypothetical protein
MTIKATQEGRNLHIRVEGVDDPFVIRPLPGRAGLQITETYIAGSTGQARAEAITEALQMAVDGAVWDEGTQRWAPLPEDEQVNYTRIGFELALAEAESVLLPAFFWQTVLGIDGVNEYIEGGEGLAGSVKALGALVARLGRLRPQTSLSTASAAPTSTASTRRTSTRPGGGKPGKQPRDRLPKQN